jgi:hypothetical protein
MPMGVEEFSAKPEINTWSSILALETKWILFVVIKCYYVW